LEELRSMDFFVNSKAMSKPAMMKLAAEKGKTLREGLGRTCSFAVQREQIMINAFSG
jgi:hypothetical protein